MDCLRRAHFKFLFQVSINQEHTVKKVCIQMAADVSNHYNRENEKITFIEMINS